MQPFVLVPTTVYNVLVVGLTVLEPPLIVYVPAPEGVMVNISPEQMVPLFTLMVGEVFTETDVAAEFVQLLVAKPMTE